MPAVDVAYTLDPPRAIVTAELAGIDPSEIELEIEGRKLILSGVRRPAGLADRRLPAGRDRAGPFQRVIELGADVRAQEAKATYEDGMLRVELPLVRREVDTRAGAHRRSRRRLMIEVGTAERPAQEVAIGATRELPHEVGVLPLRDTVTFPDMLVPLNVGQPRSVS